MATGFVSEGALEDLLSLFASREGTGTAVDGTMDWRGIGSFLDADPLVDDKDLGFVEDNDDISDDLKRGDFVGDDDGEVDDAGADENGEEEEEDDNDVEVACDGSNDFCPG